MVLIKVDIRTTTSKSLRDQKLPILVMTVLLEFNIT